MVEKIKLALERAYNERAVNARNAASSSREVQPVISRQPVDGDRSDTSEQSLSNSRYSVINTDRLIEKRVVTFEDNTEYAESFRLFRTQLLHYIETAKVSTIGITSPSSGEGKSLIALNLAISMVKSSDINVLLIDGDLSTPTIGSMLELEAPYGLVDLLNGQVQLSDVLQRINIPNLWVIPGRREAVNLMDKRHASRVEELVDGFTIGSKTIVIVDLPPVLGRDDTLAFTSNLDGVILVVEEGETKTDEISRAMNLLKQCSVLGTVLNKSTHKQSIR